MKSLQTLLERPKNIRVLGLDDAPFDHERGTPVHFAGIVCETTRMEGMLWGEITKDGSDATEVLIQTVKQSKFYDQIHVVLTDGIAMGGFNVVDLPRLNRELGRPCIAVMRKQPDFDRIFQALAHFEDGDTRRETILAAGRVHHQDPFFFQVQGCDSAVAGKVLQRLTDTGKVPEALRLAHLIGGAVKTGESGKRA
ncbi:endonuclease dU [Acanthopleuribacter pedis]|uniref:DUF99 family protein n=1 Tax=Acanthopleuribacter pedis TaxID=442870 RepID=A0A8J7U6W0_9BACT|nr:DUF99 family protein [Acanthopleuribacter pedis]MBO1321838.1 DUF99 family protein [Acanthopleuribacter pedis]